MTSYKLVDKNIILDTSPGLFILCPDHSIHHVLKPELMYMYIYSAGQKKPNYDLEIYCGLPEKGGQF